MNIAQAMRWQRGGRYYRQIEPFLTPKPKYDGWYARAVERIPGGDVVLATSGRHDNVEDAICEAATLAAAEGADHE